MSVLLDTNVLLRLSQPHHEHHAPAQAATTRLLASDEPVHVVPQNFYEFWVVATRPSEHSGLGLPTAEAAAQIDRLRIAFTLLPDPPSLYDEWPPRQTTLSKAGSASANRLSLPVRPRRVRTCVSTPFPLSRYAGRGSG